MTKLAKLKREAREAAEFRGHRLFRFRGKTLDAWAYCKTGCGMGAFVHTNPPPNGIGIHGRAVAEECPNREVL